MHSVPGVYRLRKLSAPSIPHNDVIVSVKPNAVDYETAIEATGYWKFHYLLLVVAGIASASSGMEVMYIAFVLPASECDFGLVSSEKGVLSSVALLGIMTGCYVLGGLSDSMGRRITLMVSLTVTATFGMFSSLSLNTNSFIFLRFLTGFGVGGTIPISYSYFAEFQPKGKRGAMLSFLSAFRTMGQVLIVGLAWAILPLTFDYVSPNFRFNSWRMYTVVCGIPSLVTAAALLFLPESPRYLLSQGQEQEALQVLRRIFSVNTGQPESLFPFTSLVLEDGESAAANADAGQSFLVRVNEVVFQIGRQTKMVFAPALLKVSVLMLIINFAFEFGYFGLWLWFPELFNRLANYYEFHNESVTVCEVVNYAPVNRTLAEPLDLCLGSSSSLNEEIYIENLVVAIVPIVANVWNMIHMDTFGRNFFLVFSMVGSGAAACMIWLIRSSIGNSVLSCIFNFLTAISFNTLNCLGAELFPTNIRGTAFALTLVAARFGGFVGTITFGYLVDIACSVPILLVAGLLIGGGLLGFMLPNTANKPLQ